MDSQKWEISSVVAQLGEEVSVKKQELQNVTIEKELAEEATQKANEERTTAQQEKEALLADNQDLRMENSRIESRKDRLRMENHDLKQKQLQLQTYNEELEQRHEDLQYKNSELQNVNDQLFADNHILEKRNDALQSDNQALRQKYNDLQQNNVLLERQQNELKHNIEQMVQSEQLLQRDVRKYDEAPEWQLPEPGAFASAKSFRDKVVIPFVNKLKSLIKNLTIQCVRLKEEVLQLKKEKKRLSEDVEFYKGKIKDMSDKTELLQEKADDLERVKRYAGAEQIDTIIRKVKEQERTEQQIRRYDRSYGTRQLEGWIDEMKDNRMDNIVECVYNMDNGYVEVWFTDGNMLRIKCEEVGVALRTTEQSLAKLHRLLDNKPIEYVAMALSGEMQAYCDIEDDMVKGMFGTIVQRYLKKGYNLATAEMMAREFFRYES